MARHRSIYKQNRLPKKGTKIRRLMLEALKPEGITAAEAEVFLRIPRDRLHSVIQQIVNEKGYDIRAIPNADPERINHRGKKALNIWRILGKYKLDGGYRSFIKY